MTSAIVEVFDIKDNRIRARILLDTCSTANFVTINLVKRLQLPLSRCSFSVGALNDLTTTVNGMVFITFKSVYNEYKRTLNFLVVPNITNLVPNEVILRQHLKIPKNILLADPNFHMPSTVDMLIGAGPSLSLFSIGSINLSQNGNDLYLQKTRLGWIIGGGLDFTKNSKITKTNNCLVTDLKTIIEKFWSVEELSSQSELSQEEIECEAHFKQHVTRDKDGRYVVALPFRSTTKTLGESKQIALKRLGGLQKRFERDIEFRQQYSSVIQEYLELNHMSLINIPQDEESFYLPHHGVIKDSSSTTKLRVVFNASAKSSSGVSLNDVLMVGPTIQDDLFSLIIRYRFHNYVLIADIEKMYRQFLIREEDRKYQKILWWENDKIKEYCLNTVTFGFAPSAFLATRCLQQLVEDEGHDFPLAAKILKRDLYVDNLITGASTCKQAREIYEQMNKLLGRAQLNMRQWASNEPRILEGIKDINLDKDFKINKDYVAKTLGLYWKARNDSFIYSIKKPVIHKGITKRVILSEIAKLFDPLGFIGPIILYSKLIMQELWQSKVTWDESVPSSIHYNWSNFCEQLEAVNNVSIPRKTLIDHTKKIQLHGFCDASEKGYGACLYVRADSDDGRIQCSLLCSKSRVAPLKRLTIPRLELSGALLLTNLFEKVRNSLYIEIDAAIFWTDSEIVLHWLQTNPNTLKTFVSNRVSEIQVKTSINQWRHVRSKDNPADELSRGQLPNKFVKNELWFKGPKWLSQEEDFWPKSEIRANTYTLTESKKLNCLKIDIQTSIFEKFSSFTVLKRVIAFCFRFLPKYRHCKGTLKTTELNHAETVVIRLVQKSSFYKEIENLTKGNTLSKKSKILNLDPFLCENGLLRVGGRLQNSELSFDKQHPILLPRSNFLTDLIIKYYHLHCLHAGVQTTLYAMRQRFWPIDGRNQIKKLIRKCINCFRAKPILANPKMGNLPGARVIKTRPFNRVGIDYCGPFYIKERKYRNQRKLKVYVSVFVCMTIKAIHIEVVSDLSTEGFLGALRRFISRRGKPQSIYSDNATNFQGARNELNELHALHKSKLFRDQVFNFSSNNGIEFHFIPPSSPHFGGLWEAGVKSYKHHFKRVASNVLFTFEEFYTLSVEIESILNSRPLTPISADVNDFSALTPGHFLIGDTLTNLPEPDFLPLPSNRLSAWQLISKVRQDFWKRWSIEYLNELNIRQKWHVNTENPKEGMLVLVKEDNVPCMRWPLARIHQLHPGKEGVVRSVTLKTANRLIKRPLRKIAVLPIDYEKSE